MVVGAMRMLLVLRSYFPGYSGAALRFKRYAPGLRARGVEMSVFCATTPDSKRLPEEDVSDWIDVPVGRMVPPRDVDGVQVHRVRLPGYRARTPLFGAALVRFCLRTRPDVVQVGTAELALSPWLAAVRAAGIPVVVGYTLLNVPSTQPLRRRLQRLGWRAPFELASAVVVNSSAMAASLEEIGVSRRIHTIPNGVDTERFRPPTDPAEKRALRASLDLPPDARILMSCGAMVRRKGLHLMLEAFQEVSRDRPDTWLLLVGPDRDPRYRAQLDALATPRVRFVGLVWNIEEYLRAVDAFWFASAVEGLPNAVIEAMASGLPVVSGRFLGVSPELGPPGAHWLIVDRDTESLARAMAALLDDPKRMAQLGEAARLWTTQHLGLDTATQGYAEMYEALI